MPPSVICGLTCSVRPTSTRSNVLNAELAVAAREVRIRTRLDRHVRADNDLRFFVVERDEVRRGQHVRVGGLRQRLQQRAESLHTEHVVHPADVQALLQLAARRAPWRGRQSCRPPRPAAAVRLMMLLPEPVDRLVPANTELFATCH